MRALSGRCGALRALLQLSLCAACCAGDAVSPSAGAAAFAEAELLSAPLAALVEAPCGGYAYTFRAERDGARALLAAQRVARYAACTGGGAAHCAALDALAAEPDDVPDLPAWSARAAALQSLLHELCQASAVEASRRDGSSRASATALLTSAVRCGCERGASRVSHATPCCAALHGADARRGGPRGERERRARLGGGGRRSTPVSAAAQRHRVLVFRL